MGAYTALILNIFYSLLVAFASISVISNILCQQLPIQCQQSKHWNNV